MCISAESVQVLNYENGGDSAWHRPVIKVINNGTTILNLCSLSIDYYIYETGITSSNINGTVWSFSKSGTNLPANEITITVTSISVPYLSGSKKANFLIRFICNTNTRTIAPNEYIELSAGLFLSDYPSLTKTDDWSYSGTSSYQSNNNIVISRAGTVLAGLIPDEGIFVSKTPMNWTGAYSSAPVAEDGDVYFNNTEKIAYVYSDSSWHIISNVMWQVDSNGISYKSGTVSTQKIVSDRVEVKDVVVTPVWQISNTPPDYVFEKNYDLTPLSKVEQFIYENGHLKDIPSAKEFKENGVNLVDVNMKLLRKVEELTLYTIELNKKISLISDSLHSLVTGRNQ